jgi:transposase-like protein
MNRASSSTSSCIVAAVTQGGGDNFLATVAKGDARYAPRVMITDKLKSSMAAHFNELKMEVEHRQHKGLTITG